MSGDLRTQLERTIEAVLTDHPDFMVISKIDNPHNQTVSNERMAAVHIAGALLDVAERDFGQQHFDDLRRHGQNLLRQLSEARAQRQVER